LPAEFARCTVSIAEQLNTEILEKEVRMVRIRIWLSASLLLLCCAPPAPAQEPAATVANNSSATPIRGSGTPQFVPLWLSTTSLGNSNIFQNGKRVGIGTKTPRGQFDVRALMLIPAVSTHGASAPGGSDQSGTDGIDSKGGDADPDSGFAAGGAGVRGTGGASSELFQSAGPGGIFIGGSGGGGDGIDASCGTGCFAGNFKGNLNVTGAITAGTKDFKIDHPLDPANKYLQHASVESSEMKNMYDGVVILDRNGEALVQLPDWFEVANSSFRYQLTAIGAPSPGLYIAQKISGNRFRIAGGAPGVEVSWQVTGVRQDAYAKAHPLVVEQEKNVVERGYYIHPDLYGAPEEKGIEWARNPAWMQQVKELSVRQLAFRTAAIGSACSFPAVANHDK
jgi:hypothetical protein